MTEGRRAGRARKSTHDILSVEVSSWSVIPRLFYQMQCYTYSDLVVNLSSIGDVSSEDRSTKKRTYLWVLCVALIFVFVLLMRQV